MGGATLPKHARATTTAAGREDGDPSTGDRSTTLPPLVVARTSESASRRPASSTKNAKAKPKEHTRAQVKPKTPPANNPRSPTPNANNPRTPTPTANNSRTPTPTASKPTPTARLLPLAAPPVKLITYEPTYNSTFPCKLTPLQVAALLKPFWADLLANQLKQVRRHVGESHLKKLDFNTARYAANADATPLHLCAQYGLLAMAKLLVGEFALAATLRNKVGSTPLHVACKLGKRELVSWLVDELRVPLDVPDAHHRLALDVAPFETVDKCVLAPLQRQRAELRQRESELVDQNNEARERLERAQLAFRRHAMALGDAESRACELRAEIEQVSALERHWHEQWQARNDVLDELMAQYDLHKQELEEEQQRAQVLFERDVKAGREEHERAQQELDELQALVDTTQRELDRRRQLLVDQLGVFDASLREFGGNRDVQLWALATLQGIARDERAATADEVDRTELLLRQEPVAVVRHVLGHVSDRPGVAVRGGGVVGGRATASRIVWREG